MSGSRWWKILSKKRSCFSCGLKRLDIPMESNPSSITSNAIPRCAPPPSKKKEGVDKVLDKDKVDKTQTRLQKHAPGYLQLDHNTNMLLPIPLLSPLVPPSPLVADKLHKSAKEEEALVLPLPSPCTFWHPAIAAAMAVSETCPTPSFGCPPMPRNGGGDKGKERRVMTTTVKANDRWPPAVGKVVANRVV